MLDRPYHLYFLKEHGWVPNPTKKFTWITISQKKLITAPAAVANESEQLSNFNGRIALLLSSLVKEKKVEWEENTVNLEKFGRDAFFFDMYNAYQKLLE